MRSLEHVCVDEERRGEEGSTPFILHCEFSRLCLFIVCGVAILAHLAPPRSRSLLAGVEIEEDLADKFRRRVTAKGLESKVGSLNLEFVS